tara:strand:+ start:149 stop:937 length:789 start_codon:yes stop_codon:yes gene_type:complete
MNFEIFFYSILSFLTVPILGQIKNANIDLYQAQIWKESEDLSLYYRTAQPEKMEMGQKYPLLLFFHGSGGRGSDNISQLIDAGGLQAFEKVGIRNRFKSHFFAGQVPKSEKWVNTGWGLLGHKMPKISQTMRMTFDALDAYVSDPKNQVDLNRIYVMGLSMGGYGTWDAIQRRPDYFAAAVPICGGGDKSLAKKLIQLPIWAWHGEKDNVIKPTRSRDMIKAISKAGGSPKYSEIKGRGHNSWVDCWNSDVLWNWVFSQSKK